MQPCQDLKNNSICLFVCSEQVSEKFFVLNTLIVHEDIFEKVICTTMVVDSMKWCL